MFKKIRNTIKLYKLSNINFRLLIYTFTVTIIGILTIESAAPNEGYQIKQILGLGLGFVAFLFFGFISYRLVFKFYWLAYLLMNALLMSVLLIGYVSKGAKRWIDLGFTRFQPSELAKVLLIVFIAAFIEKRYETLNSFKTLGGVALFSAIPIGLILIEPDLSTTLVIFITFCVIMFLSGMHRKIITTILVISLPIAAIFIYFVIQPDTGPKILKQYQYDRIVGFFQEDNEAAKRIRYQQENSLLAIGSGGLTGKGLYNDDATSVKNGNLLAESHTDFIFTIIGEELGFIGSASVILLLYLIVFECFLTGARAPSIGGRLYCYGFGSLLGIQTFVNISVATLLLPNTGITLPFVSYGLTSLLSLYIGIAIVINIGLQRNRGKIR